MPSSETELPRYADVWPDARPPAGPPEQDATPEEEEPLFRTPFPRPRVGALRNILATLAVAAVIVGLVWFFDRPAGFGSSQAITLTAAASGPAPRLDKPAPEFQVQTLDGTTVQLSDFRGRPVWVSFWATWCPPCRAENPDIQEVYEKYQPDGLVILALSIGEDRDTVQGYVERTGLTYTIGLDQTTEIAARYRIVGIPTHFFVDRDGILREWRIGSMSKKTMEKNVAEIMSPSTAAPDQ